MPKIIREQLLNRQEFEMTNNDSIFVHAKEELGETRFRAARAAGINLAGSMTLKVARKVMNTPFSSLSLSAVQSVAGGQYMVTDEFYKALDELTNLRDYFDDMCTKATQTEDWFSAVAFKTARAEIKRVRMLLNATYTLKWPIPRGTID